MFIISTNDLCILILEEELPTHGDIVSFVNIEAPLIGHRPLFMPRQCTLLSWRSHVMLNYENVTVKFCHDTSKANILCTDSQTGISSRKQISTLLTTTLIPLILSVIVQ